MRDKSQHVFTVAAAIGLAAAVFCVSTAARAERPAPDRPSSEGEYDQPRKRQARPNAPEKGRPDAKGGDGKAGDGVGAKADAKPALPLKGKADTAESRAKLLNDLYAHLAAAEDETRAQMVAEGIERMWLNSGSDTISLLMERAAKAAAEKKLDLTLNLLGAVTDLAPDYPEGFMRRAFVFYSENNLSAAMGDLRRVLALDANNYKALEGVAQIFKETGNKKAALKAYEQLLRVHPFAAGAKDALKELQAEVEGQGI